MLVPRVMRRIFLVGGSVLVVAAMASWSGFVASATAAPALRGGAQPEQMGSAVRGSAVASPLAALSPVHALGWLSFGGDRGRLRSGPSRPSGLAFRPLRLAIAGRGPSGTGRAAQRALPTAGSTWSQAEKLPGSGALNTGGAAVLAAMSCPSAGACEASGYFTTSSEAVLPFVDSQVGGDWRDATELPGATKFSPGGAMAILSMSCASVGNCSVGGVYNSQSSPTSETGQAFVASEANGRWHDPIEVAGALNAGDDAEVSQVSCASAGNCAAVGYYSDSAGNVQPFVTSESGGSWHGAGEVPGAGDAGAVITVSCGSAGNCTAAGQYGQDSTLELQAFVVSEVKGAWGSAKVVPGSENLNSGGSAQINAVSCASAGNCTAVGNFTDSSGTSQALAATESGGKWAAAFPLPGTGALNTSGDATGGVVSCASAGNCGIGGEYNLVISSSSGLPESGQTFIASEVAGRWSAAKKMPGSAVVNQEGADLIDAISCPSGGNCAAGGFSDYTGTSAEPFVISEVNDAWDAAEIVPGLAQAKSGSVGFVTTVSCAAPGDCGAGGEYTDGSGKSQAFVTGEKAAGCSGAKAASAVPAGTAAAQCYPVGIYSDFSGSGGEQNASLARKYEWPSIASVSGLSRLKNMTVAKTCQKPYTQGTGADNHIEKALGAGSPTTTWAVSYWTVAAPPPSVKNLKEAGEQAGRQAGTKIREAYNTEKASGGHGILPAVVALDPEGYPCGGRPWTSTKPKVTKPLSPAQWKEIVTGWGIGLRSEKLTPAIYVSSSEYKVNDVKSFGMDIILAAGAVCPLTATTCPIPSAPKVTIAEDPHIVGYATYYGPVTAKGVCENPAADLARIASWGAPYSTLQFGYLKIYKIGANKTKTVKAGISKICRR